MSSYVITGHSTETTDTFTVPSRIKIIFYANDGETCYVPNDNDSLNFVIQSMIDGNYETYTEGSTVPNYSISFEDVLSQGIAKIKGMSNYEFINDKNDKQLKNVCNYLQKTNRGEITLYCIFCRGSNREFSDEFGDFSGMDIDDIDFMDHPLTGGFNKIKRNKTNKCNKTKRCKTKRRKTKRCKTKRRNKRIYLS